MSRYRWALTVLVAVAAAAVVITTVLRTTPPSAAAGMGNAALIPTDQRQAAADFTGVDGWLNSPPLAMAQLRGKVVLVDFWTYSCVNCVRTIPHLQHLQATYGARGLVIVGVHSPEFDFEKVRSNVVAAVHRYGVTWPVALDSQMNTWNAYGNQYWPAEYLIDSSGRVAYIHDGEGQYDVTESAISSLLGLRNATPAAVSPTPDQSAQTPELYVGGERGQLGGGESYGGSGRTLQYPDTGAPRDQDQVLLSGSWTDQSQYLVSASAGHVRLNFSARDLYIVAGPSSSHLQVHVTLDGAAVPIANRGPDLAAAGLTVDSQRLYHVLSGLPAERHLIDLIVPVGLRLYTFTFG